MKRDDQKAIQVLFEISEAVTTTRDLDDLFQSIHQSLSQIFNVKNFYIALYHEDRDSITFPYHVDEMDEDPEEILNFSETASLTGQVIKARKPLIFYKQDILGLARNQDKETIGTVCEVWIGAPLVVRERTIGVIAMQSFHSANDYKESDLALLNAISQHIALAIERKEVSEKFIEQQRVLEKILESSPVGICLVENRVFKWVNSEMLRLFGYESKADFKKQDVRMIYASEEDYITAGKTIYQDLESNGKADFYFDLRKKDGSFFKAHMIIAGSRRKNPLSRTIVTIADVSEQDLAQKEKIEREKLQGVLEMAGAVCHEINQPLQTIIGYSSLFREDGKLRRKDLENIKDQATKIGAITKRLSNITHYKTIDYPGNARIVDIWGSSSEIP